MRALPSVPLRPPFHRGNRPQATGNDPTEESESSITEASENDDASPEL